MVRKQGKTTLKEVRGKGRTEGKGGIDLLEKINPKCTALRQLWV